MKTRQVWGYIDTTGKFVIQPEFDGAWEFHEGLAAVKIDWARGYINHSGEFVIEPKFQQAGSFNDGVAWVMDDNRYGLIDKEGKYIIEPKYEKASDFIDGIAQVMKDGEFIYIDHNGKEVSAPENPQQVIPSPELSEGLEPVWVKNKCGYKNESGEMVIPARFIQAKPFSEGLAPALTKIKQD